MARGKRIRKEGAPSTQHAGFRQPEAKLYAMIITIIALVVIALIWTFTSGTVALPAAVQETTDQQAPEASGADNPVEPEPTSQYSPAEWYELGMQKAAEGDIKGAISLLENCADTIPDCGYDFGHTLGKNGETQIASNAIYAAFRLGFLPRTAHEADVVLASLFSFNSSPSQVHKVIAHTLQLPDLTANQRGKLQGTLGFTLVKASQFKEALPHLEEAVKVASTDGQVLYTLGVALYMVNREEEGLAQLEKVAGLKDEAIAGDANCFLYGIYKSGGELELAHAHRQRGLQLNPHSPMCNLKDV